METFNNEKIIQQGEDWNLDIKLSQSNTEYIPYIVSKQRENPMFVMTVASTKFDKTDRYVESWWQDLTDEPRFNYTRPFGIINEFDEDPISFADLLDKITDETIRAEISTDEPMDRLYQYKVSSDNNFRYCYTTDGEDIVVGYELRLRFNIPAFLDGKPISAGTGNWTPQEYMYEITLVSGQLMTDTLIEAIRAYPNLPWNEDMPKIIDYPNNYNEKLLDWLNEGNNKVDTFNIVKNHVPDFFQYDIEADSPLGRIWSPVPIITPTKITVNSNLRVLI